MIKTAIDTEAIGKYIGFELYKITTQKNITQKEIEYKCGILQTTISAYFTGKKTTKNLDQYWRIAEAIPITRKEFDSIVEDAKRKVLGDYGTKEVNEDPEMAYATLARRHGVSPDDVKKAVEMYKVWKN